MLWHALNNALGLLAYKLQVPESGLDPVCYLAAGGMLAVAFWIFWCNRTPYPGLKQPEKQTGSTPLGSLSEVVSQATICLDHADLVQQLEFGVGNEPLARLGRLCCSNI
jgi:hypothetical protein